MTDTFDLSAEPIEFRIVTPRTVAYRFADGRVNVLLFTEGKNADGIYGFLKCSSTRIGGKWNRLWEHPQEWIYSTQQPRKSHAPQVQEADPEHPPHRQAC